MTRLAGSAQSTDASVPQQLPLFPLPDAVLFPKMPLPLHVFEPRYRQLVAAALRGDQMIGMTLLRPGWEGDYEGRPPIYAHGCAGRLEQCERLDDGRFTLVLRGVARFRIVEEHSGEAYRVATVDPLVDECGDGAVLERARQDVLKAIVRADEGASALMVQQDVAHEVFVNALCQSLALEPVEQQSLLACASILDRYQRLIEILDFKRLEAQQGGTASGSLH
jgi:Lon protease-like protein